MEFILVLGYLIFIYLCLLPVRVYSLSLYIVSSLMMEGEVHLYQENLKYKYVFVTGNEY
jgi:hypothetical protein